MWDRTREYRATLDAARARQPAGVAIREAKVPLSEFTRRASDISAALFRLRATLAELRHAVGGTLDDTEVAARAASAKGELSRLHAQVVALDDVRGTFGRGGAPAAGGYGILSGGGGPTASGEEHAEQVLALLRSRLAESGGALGAALEAHAAAARQQRERRDRFSAVAPGSYASPFGGASSGSGNAPVGTFKKSNAMEQQGAVMARRAGESQQHARHQHEAQGHTAIEMHPFTNTGGDQLQQLVARSESEAAHADAQNAAMQGIERTITELGALYTRIASLIAEQSEGVRRIDVHIGDVHMNVARGRTELRRYLRRMSSNRWLMVRIFAAVILFLIFVRIFF